MANTFSIKLKDGSTEEFEVWTAEEIKRYAHSGELEVKSKVNKVLKAFGVPPPNLMRIGGEKREELLLKGYAEHGISANGTKAKAAPATAPAPAAEAPKAEPKPVTNGAAANGAASAAPVIGRANGKAAEPAPSAGGGEVAQLLKALRSEIRSLHEKVDALQAAEQARLEQDALRDAAIVQLYDVSRETLQYGIETHFLTRCTGPLGAGVSEEDVLACQEEMHQKFLIDPVEIADLALAETIPGEEGEEAEEEEEEQAAEGNA